jgi:protein TonB
MEPKKNPEVNLERKRALFLQIGLVIALLVVLGAFEYKTYEKIAYNLGSLSLDDLEEEIIPLLSRK